MGVVYHTAPSPHVEVRHAAQETAPYLGFELVVLPVRTVPEIEAGMTGVAAAGAANDVVVAPHAPTLGSRMRITGLAGQYRLPGNYGDASFARSGGRLSYGVDAPDQLQRAAGSVTAILKGAYPAEPPVELPSRYAMIISRVAAQELDRVGPSAPLARAEEVIEESDSDRCPRTRHAGRRAAPRTDPAPR